MAVGGVEFNASEYGAEAPESQTKMVYDSAGRWKLVTCIIPAFSPGRQKA